MLIFIEKKCVPLHRNLEFFVLQFSFSIVYYISKRIEISACHHLTLNYESQCTKLHGHNWIITVHCKSETLNENGMVCDFADIKRIVKDQLDHANLNEVLDCNPTAENIARWITERVPKCYKTEVQETEGNTVVYTTD